MGSVDLMHEIRMLDSEIKGIDTLTQNLMNQLSNKKKSRDQLRIELKVAFVKERNINQPAARHADIYVE